MEWSNDPGRQATGPGSTGEMRTVKPEELPDLLKRLAAEHADNVLWITAIRDHEMADFQVRARIVSREEGTR